MVHGDLAVDEDPCAFRENPAMGGMMERIFDESCFGGSGA